nr:unnamed protein product [Callosobruchus analis]
MDTKQMRTNKNEAFLPTNGTDRKAAAAIRPSLPPRVPPAAGRYDARGAQPKCAIVDVVLPPFLHRTRLSTRVSSSSLVRRIVR